MFFSFPWLITHKLLPIFGHAVLAMMSQCPSELNSLSVLLHLLKSYNKNVAEILQRLSILYGFIIFAG